ncbi:MAG: hypothetical protein IPO67_17335 [Deltaproteobacteria bacterium]|nr:hypothetical protein [Deltaproteobacteria bacterium]
MSLFNTIGTLGSPIGRIGVTTLGWSHVYDEAQAARWLERRCAALQGGSEGIESIGSMTPLPASPSTPKRSSARRPLRPRGARPQGQRAAGRGHPHRVNYVELWVLQDNTLRLPRPDLPGAGDRAFDDLAGLQRLCASCPGAKVPEEVTNEALEAGLSAGADAGVARRRAPPGRAI